MLNNVTRRIASGIMAFAIVAANVVLPAMPAFATTVDNKNDFPYWCGANGVKFDTGAIGTHVKAPITIKIEDTDPSDEDKTGVTSVTASEGYTVTKVVVKGGSKGGDGEGNAAYTPAFIYPLMAPSYVENNKTKQPDVSHVIVCYQQTPKVATAQVSTTPPTCQLGEKLVYGAISNATFSGTPDGTTGPAPYSVTATAVANATFSGNSTTKLFEGQLSGPLTGGQCEEQPKDNRETRIVEDEPVCTPAGQGTVDYFTEERTRSYTLVDNVWTAGEWSAWTKVADSDKTRPATLEECPLVKVTPGTPQITDLCGKSNDTYVLPTTDHVTYSAVKNGNTVTVTATPGQGYYLDLTGTMDWTLNQNGTATYTFEFTNIKCDKVTICHRTNSVTNPYRKITVSVNAVDGIAGNNGNRADHFDEHKGPVAISEAYAQSLKDQKQKWGDIIPPISGIHQGYNWPAGQAMYENDCDYIVEVTPEEPSIVDFCYDDRDYVTVPSAHEGYSYFYNEQDVSGQTIPYTGDGITVTAVANKGHVFPAEATTMWAFTSEDFSNEDCLTITKEFKSVTDTNQDGKISIDDTITWEITVTNTSDDEVFNVIVSDEDVILEDNGYIGNLGPNESKTLTATSTITLEQAAVCKAENTAMFSGRRPLIDYTSERFNIISDNEMAPLATGSATDNYVWDCTPGQGGNETPETPEEPETPKTPIVLPNTSGASTGIVAISALSLASLILVAGTAIKSRLLS